MSKRAVGLDLGSSSVKAAQVRISKAGAIVERLNAVSLRPGLIQEGLVVPETTEEISFILKEFWKSSGFKTKDVVLGMNNSSAVTARIAEIPWRTPDDLRDSIAFEVSQKQIFAASMDEIEMDYFVLDDQNTSKGRMLQVFLVSVSRDQIEANVDAARRAGLKVVGVDINPFAGLRAARLPVNDNRSTYDILVDIGADLMTLTIHNNGTPRFVHFSPDESGNGVTEHLRRVLNLSSFGESEAVKIQGGSHSPETAAVLDKVTTRVSISIRKLIDHFMKTNPHVTGIGSVSIIGGGALLDGLVTKVEESLDVPVDIGELDVRFLNGRGESVAAYNPEGFSMTVASGLAVGAKL